MFSYSLGVLKVDYIQFNENPTHTGSVHVFFINSKTPLTLNALSGHSLVVLLMGQTMMYIEGEQTRRIAFRVTQDYLLYTITIKIKKMITKLESKK